MYFATFLLKNLVRRKARSLLTILGIAVAIGTVVTLRGVSYGFERSFRANFERRGINRKNLLDRSSHEHARTVNRERDARGLGCWNLRDAVSVR